MWGGRFREPLDPEILEFTSSFDIDRRLLRYDLAASIAHAQMLGTTGIIPHADAQLIVDGLRGMAQDAEAGALEVAGPYEDVHSYVEAVLYDRIGAAAGRLHTARSRNDQVVTAFRLYVKDRVSNLVTTIGELMALIVEQAAATIDVLIPGFTHLQHAQPVRLAHHLLAYFWMLERDIDRLKECFRRCDVLPLGSGAVAGVGYPIDRREVAQALGFRNISENSTDAVADRDFAIDAVAAAATLMVHLSRWAAEIVTWASEEFGFIRLADAVAHGSSIMPQKKNPDAAELVRARAGRIIGNLTALLATIKGVQLGYQSDLQEDKALTFDALDVAGASVRTMRRLLERTEFVAERLRRATGEGLLTATEAADYLVRKGVPFREAHQLVGRLVSEALARGVQMWEIPHNVYRSISPQFEPDVLRAVTVEAAVEAKQAPGGTARSAVEAQLEAARDSIAAVQAWAREAESASERVESLLGGSG